MTSDGESVSMKLTEKELDYWGFFAPYTSGRQPPSVDDPLDLTAEEAREWLLLVNAMKTSVDGKRDFVVRASKAYHAADYYFMPSDDTWRYYMHIDDLEDEEATKNALLDTGYALRDMGKLMSYHIRRRSPTAMTHKNFCLRSDPVLDVAITLEANGSATKRSLWSKPVSREQKDRALAIDDISALTAIVHSAYLLMALEDRGSVEVPWQYINWKHVVKYVSDPWMLCSANQQLYGDRDKFITELEEGTRTDLRETIGVDMHVINAMLFSPALIGYDPNTPLQLYESKEAPRLRAHRVERRLEDVKFSLTRAGLPGNKKRLGVDLPAALQFYLGALNYLATRPITNEEPKYHDRLTMCGLAPLLNDMSLDKYSKLYDESLSILQRRSRAEWFGSALSIVPIVTMKALYQGHFFEQDDGSYDVKPLDEKDFDAAIDYIIATLGSTAAVVMATVAMEHYMLTESEDHQRLLDFAILVESKTNDREVPASRLP